MYHDTEAAATEAASPLPLLRQDGDLHCVLGSSHGDDQRLEALVSASRPAHDARLSIKQTQGGNGQLPT